MRLRAYKQAIDEAKRLPDSIPELSNYFENPYDPRFLAVEYILATARCDTKALYHSEFIELYEYSKK